MAETGINGGARLPVAPLRFVEALFKSPGVKPSDTRIAMLVKAAEITLIVVLALLLVRLLVHIWGVFVPAEMPAGEPIVITAAPAPAVAENAAPNPFATKAAVVAAPEQVAVETLQETSLDLVLHGTWIDESGATAFISEKNGPQKRYQVGDRIVSGVRLQEVHKEWVALSRGGAYEALRIKNRKAPAAGSEQKKESVTASGTPAPGEARSLDAIFRVSVENGAIVLNPGNDGEVAFYALGFESGDILRAVDGVPVTDLQSAPAVVKQLTSQSAAKVTVERRGAPVTWNVSLQSGEAGGDDDDA